MATDLEVRKALHSILDPVWQSAQVSRSAIYAELSGLIGREAHVSDMSAEEMRKCAEYLLARTAEAYPCYKCKHCIAYRLNIPVCDKRVERGILNCGKFAAKDL